MHSKVFGRMKDLVCKFYIQSVRISVFLYYPIGQWMYVRNWDGGGAWSHACRRLLYDVSLSSIRHGVKQETTIQLQVMNNLIKLQFIQRLSWVDVNFQKRDWLNGGNDNRIKWRCNLNLTKYGKSECDWLQ